MKDNPEFTNTDPGVQADFGDKIKGMV